jgi:hypothetical protein
MSDRTRTSEAKARTMTRRAERAARASLNRSVEQGFRALVADRAARVEVSK